MPLFGGGGGCHASPVSRVRPIPAAAAAAAAAAVVAVVAGLRAVDAPTTCCCGGSDEDEPSVLLASSAMARSEWTAMSWGGMMCLKDQPAYQSPPMDRTARPSPLEILPRMDPVSRRYAASSDKSAMGYA